MLQFQLKLFFVAPHIPVLMAQISLPLLRLPQPLLQLGHPRLQHLLLSLRVLGLFLLLTDQHCYFAAKPFLYFLEPVLMLPLGLVQHFLVHVDLLVQ